MIERNLQIEMVKIDTLKPYPNNAKLHPEEHVTQIVASILEFGFNDPIGITEDGTVLEGHGRLLAAKQIGLTEVPVIRLDKLTDEQKKAYIITHNKLTLNTDFDLEKLNAELQSLDESLRDITGFTDEEISEIFDSLTTKEEKNIVEPEDSEPVSKLGDIWILDKHKVLCGSSTEEESYKKLLNGELIDLVVTDPPYNVDFKNETTGMTIVNDNLPDAEFKKFLNSFYEQTAKYLKNGKSFYIFYATLVGDAFLSEIKKSQLSLKQILIWVKTSFAFGRADYHWRHEPIMYGWKEGASHYFTYDRTQSTVIDDYQEEDYKKKSKKELLEIIKEMKDSEPITTDIIYHDKPSKSDLHPTMKPVNLLKRLMRNSSLKDDLVFDGFLGSGSTLIASEQLSRKCYGIELDEHYVDVIVKRYIQYKTDNNEPYEIKLIRDGKEIKLEDTGLLDDPE